MEATPTGVIMEGVREYAEAYDAVIATHENGRIVIEINYLEGGLDISQVDLLDLLEWVRVNRPDLMQASGDIKRTHPTEQIDAPELAEFLKIQWQGEHATEIINLPDNLTEKMVYHDESP